MSPRKSLWKMQWFTCHECGCDIPEPTTNQFTVFRSVARMFCGTTCSYRYRGKLSSKRMLLSNPTEEPSVRKRISMTMRKNGHKPIVQGGKGRSMTHPQKKLLEALEPEWIPEWVIKTGLPKCDGNATWYSADLAHVGLKLCVKVDGGSHCTLAARERDARRDDLLSQLGWTTLRFSNKDVLHDLGSMAAKIKSTISRLKETRTTSRKTSWFTTAT